MSDSQDNAPLLERRDGDDDDGAQALKVAGGRPGVFIWVLTLSAGISGLLFGCEVPSLIPFFPLPHFKVQY